jgi:hypothetical protein
MRELRDWHGDRHRHARDAAADVHAKHAADSPRLRVLSDPEVRKAEFFKYQKIVQEHEAKHATGRLKPQEAKPEHAPPETRDKPAGKIAERTKPPERQEQKQRKPERSRLPANDTTQMVAGIGIAVSSVADALNILPGKWDAVAASFLGAAVASVAWGNRRWKDRHGS